jgi:uncharacterized membrane protein
MKSSDARTRQKKTTASLSLEVEGLPGTPQNAVSIPSWSSLSKRMELFHAIRRFDVRTQQWIAWALLVAFMLLYAVDMSHQALLRYDTFKATAFDLGNMDQVLWNTIHGRLFQFTNQAIDWYGPPTRLAVHFEPIILPLSLLYVFHADPRILLVFQTLVLVSGAVPIFLLTRKHIPEWPLVSALMVLAYFLAPALLGLNIFDFHPISLATPLLLYAVLALTYKRYVWFLVACILAASCKEDVPLSIAMLGILVIWQHKSPRLGITLIIGGLLWSFLAFFVIIPHFFPGAQHNNFLYRYDPLGGSLGAFALNLLLHPWQLFITFITPGRIFYLAGLLRSVGFLSLLAPEWLLPALPILAENMLSTDPLLYSGVYHYNANIIPFIMISAILGTRRLIAFWRTWRGEAVVEPSSSDEQHSTSQRNTLVSGAFLEKASAVTRKVRQSALYIRIVTLIEAALGRIKDFGNLQWRRFSERMVPIAREVHVPRLQWVVSVWVISMLSLNLAIAIPSLSGFWADHEPGSREQRIQQLLALIPPDASVSAGSNLNPHLSERQRLAVFPSPLNTSVQYIIVDLNAVFPEDRTAMANELNQLVASGQFRELARAEGVVLLVRRST